MRNTLKFLATAVLATLLVCMICMNVSAANTKFTDVDDKNETLSEAVALLSHLNITKGTSDTTFGTNENVTRQQMAAFTYRLLKGGKTLENVSNTTKFTDLKDSTYFGYISWAQAAGVINGRSATEFDPEGGIILQDAYTMLIRAMGYDDGSLSYPYDYIDLAESEDVDLAEGLPSNVGLDTTLTRGNVAILLYNAFFGETAYTKTEQKEKLLGGKSWVLEEKEVNMSLAEYAYDVEVGEFVVRATPKYSFNDAPNKYEYAPLYDQFNGNSIQLVATESDEAVKMFYCEFEDTGLSGKADDYIMNYVNVYYTTETKNNAKVVDDVLFISSALRTIDTNTVKVEFKKGDNPTDKLGTTNHNDPEGYLTVNNEKIYFYDAPYSYIKPDYSIADSDNDRYLLRNEKNCKFINLELLDKEENTYNYYVEDVEINTAEEMYKSLIRVMAGGIYKMKFYDVDGDGIYEYVHYKPAVFGQMDADEAFIFSDDMPTDKISPAYPKNENAKDLDLKVIPKIYTNEANITGKPYFDEDFVLAYVNPKANMIEVYDVVAPFKGHINDYDTDNGTFRIENTTFRTPYSTRYVENLYNGTTSAPNSLGAHAANLRDYFYYLTNKEGYGEIFNVYAYKIAGNDNVFYYTYEGEATLGYNEKELAVPVMEEKRLSGGKLLTIHEYDKKKDINYHYVRMYINGVEKSVPVNFDEMNPKPAYDAATGSYVLYDVNDASAFSYIGKLCSYEVDKNGLYILKPLMHALDVDDSTKYIGINRDSSVLKEKDCNDLFANEMGDREGVIVKGTNFRYELLTPAGRTLLGDPYSTDPTAETLRYFTMTSSSKIIIRNTIPSTTPGKDPKVEYLTFDKTTFTGETETKLTNIQYILKANPSSNITADLVLLYAEATDFEFVAGEIKNGYRVVLGSTRKTDATADGEYRCYYKLYNPFTGAIEESVPGTETAPKASNLTPCAVGTVIEIKGGKVDEDGNFLGKLDTSDNSTGLVWITEYEAADNQIVVVPTSVLAAQSFCCDDAIPEFAENWVYTGVEKNFDGEAFIVPVDENDNPVYNTPLYYEITDDTVISVVNYETAGTTTFRNGTFTLADVDAIANPTKANKCYNENVLDKDNNYKTVYAPYLKAYVSVSEAKDEEDTPVVDYIIIVVNGDEELCNVPTTKCPLDIHG